MVNGTTISTISDYVDMEKQALEAKGETWTSTKSAYYTAETTANYKTPDVVKYALDGTTLKLTPHYFSGTLPTTAGFEVSLNSGYIELTAGDAGRIKIKDNGTKYYGFPTYSNGTFSGTLYEGHGEKSVGTIAGTYTTSGTGTSGSTVTLTFTTLPTELTEIEKNKEYTLEQDSSEGNTGSFTLVE